MNQPAKAQEPSMEEILASIRRIIADDDSKPPPRPQPVAAAPKPAAPPPRPAAPPPPPEPVQQHEEMLAPMEPAPEPEPQDVLDLTEQMTETAVEPPSFQTIDGQSDVVFADPQPEPPPRPVEPPRVFAPLPPQDGLMSSSTSAAVDSAFNSLAHTVLVQNARTLEDLVREMLRPMLKSWLDDNLPSMVERIVKLEIERVSRGRG